MVAEWRAGLLLVVHCQILGRPSLAPFAPGRDRTTECMSEHSEVNPLHLPYHTISVSRGYSRSFHSVARTLGGLRPFATNPPQLLPFVAGRLAKSPAAPTNTSFPPTLHDRFGFCITHPAAPTSPSNVDLPEQALVNPCACA